MPENFGLARPVQTFWDVLEGRAELCGDRPAIVQGQRQLTFGEWRRRAAAVSAWYTARFARGGRVLLWMDSSPDAAVALLGFWRAGAIVSLIDTRSKAGHFEHGLRIVDPAAIVYGGRDIPPSDVARDRAVDFADVESAAPQDPVPPPALLPTGAAYIIFTSGSTGPPKGVTQSHGNLLAACRAATAALTLTGRDRLLCTTPLAFSFGCGHLLSMLLTGGTLVLPEVMNTFGICGAIAAHRPTFLAGIPPLYIQLLRSVSPIRSLDLSSIRAAMTSGGRLPVSILEDLQALLPGRQIFLNYGLTESYRSTCLDPAQVRRRPTSVGRPIAGVDIIVLRDDGTVASAHEIGEIVHRGAHICLGYWNDPASTARALRPDPLAPAGCPGPPPALYTGDYGYLDEEGYLYFHGRRDQQVKSMGVRVSPPEVEDLLHASGLVTDVAVVSRPHELLENELWAVCVPRADAGTDLVPRLRAYARTTMSPFMSPRRFLIVSDLPRTSTGKIDYAAISTQLTTIA